MAVGKTPAAFGPADDRRDAQAETVQVVALLGRGEVDIRARPLAAPVILVIAVELRRSHPVGQCELFGVMDSEAALLGGVDEEQPAERPERLTAEVVAILLVDDQHSFARLGQFVGGNETGEAGPDDDRVSGEILLGTHGSRA